MDKDLEKRLDISGIDQTQLLGASDAYFKKIALTTKARITVRGSQIILQGDEAAVHEAEKVFVELIILYNKKQGIRERDVDSVLAVISQNASKERLQVVDDNTATPILYTRDAAIKPKTEAQRTYFEAVADNDITFGIGPAGTGKTYLAVAMAVAHLRDKHISKIVLTRPAVEAGESLGYLPGDLLEKVDPYLRPLYDALGDMIQNDKLSRYLERKIIEVVPLAYMRGRTLNGAFVILDEAQNTTAKQMKMFLTRLGLGSKAIITGDITQIDLPSATESGLIQVQSVLKNIPGISFVYMNEHDVVRHRLVMDIIRAYDHFDESV